MPSLLDRDFHDENFIDRAEGAAYQVSRLARSPGSVDLSNGGEIDGNLQVTGNTTLSGDVGIGTDSPASSIRLHIDGGGLQVDRNLLSFIDLKVLQFGASTDRARIEWRGDDLLLRNVEGGTFRVAIGRTSAAYPFDVYGDAKTYAARFFNDGNASDRNGILIRAGQDSNPTHYWVRFEDGGGTRLGQIAGGGSGDVLYQSVSDERVKEDIQSLGPSLDDVLSLRPVSYRGVGGGPDGNRSVGLVAQEVEQHIPTAVTQSADNGLYAIDYGRMVPHLIKAIQELESRVAALEAA